VSCASSDEAALFALWLPTPSNDLFAIKLRNGSEIDPSRHESATKIPDPGVQRVDYRVHACCHTRSVGTKSPALEAHRSHPVGGNVSIASERIDGRTGRHSGRLSHHRCAVLPIHCAADRQDEPLGINATIQRNDLIILNFVGFMVG
jgi:hypothetical protein